MNKSALLGLVGFLVGIGVIAGAVLLMQRGGETPAPKTAAEPATPAPKPPTSAARQPNEPAPAPTPAEGPSELTLTRNIANNGAFTPGEPVDVTVTLAIGAGEDIRALGLQEDVPEGWTFDSIVDGQHPDLAPSEGRGERLEFAWFRIPKFPTSFTYRLNTPAEADGGAAISGQAIYRTNGPELRSNVAKSMLREPGANPRPPASVGGPGMDKPLDENADKPLPAAAEAVKPAPNVEDGPMSDPDDASTDEAATDGADADETTNEDTDAEAKTRSGEGFTMARSVADGAYLAASPIDIEIALDFRRSDTITALAVQEDLPPGWVFEGVTGGDKPTVEPPQGRTGTITFLWINIPAFPTQFTYTASVPAGETGDKEIKGVAVFRTDGPEERIEPVVTTLSATAAE